MSGAVHFIRFNDHYICVMLMLFLGQPDVVSGSRYCLCEVNFLRCVSGSIPIKWERNFPVSLGGDLGHTISGFSLHSGRRD